jgi:hypothetical protein
MQDWPAQNRAFSCLASSSYESPGNEVEQTLVGETWRAHWRLRRRLPLPGFSSARGHTKRTLGTRLGFLASGNGLSQSLAFLPEDRRLGERDWTFSRLHDLLSPRPVTKLKSRVEVSCDVSLFPDKTRNVYYYLSCSFPCTVFIM